MGEEGLAVGEVDTAVEATPTAGPPMGSRHSTFFTCRSLIAVVTTIEPGPPASHHGTNAYAIVVLPDALAGADRDAVVVAHGLRDLPPRRQRREAQHLALERVEVVAVALVLSRAHDSASRAL